MPNNEEPGASGTPGLVAGTLAALSKLDLPRLIGGPAAEALGRVCGRRIELRGIPTEARLQEEQDMIELKSQLRRRLGEQAIERAVQDEALVGRALNKLFDNGLREQINREQVASEAANVLLDAPPGPEAEVPDEDWLDRFEDLAARASSDATRQLFGRILSGEIRQPSRFSFATLHIASMMDRKLAALIQKLHPLVLDNRYIFGEFATRYISLEDRMSLMEMGILVSEKPSHTCTKTQWEGQFIVSQVDYIYIGDVGSDSPREIRIPSLILTRSGIEIMSALELLRDPVMVAHSLYREGLTNVRYAPISRVAGDGGVRWLTSQEVPVAPEAYDHES